MPPASSPARSTASTRRPVSPASRPRRWSSSTPTPASAAAPASPPARSAPSPPTAAARGPAAVRRPGGGVLRRLPARRPRPGRAGPAAAPAEPPRAVPGRGRRRRAGRALHRRRAAQAPRDQRRRPRAADRCRTAWPATASRPTTPRPARSPGSSSRSRDQPGFRYRLGVEVGRDVSVEELEDDYDAVVYADGASADRPLGVPGDALPGVVGATTLAAWGNGHPGRRDLTRRWPRWAAARAVVVGAGNVALDTARLLRPAAGRGRRGGRARPARGRARGVHHPGADRAGRPARRRRRARRRRPGRRRRARAGCCASSRPTHGDRAAGRDRAPLPRPVAEVLAPTT